MEREGDAKYSPCKLINERESPARDGEVVHYV